MHALVGGGSMNKVSFTSVKKLMAATSEMGGSTAPIKNQVGRIQARLNQGVTSLGQSMAPYKDPKRKYGNSRPLQRASRLFDSPEYSIEKTFSGVDMRATITGQAAKIAMYQNVRRNFLSFSEENAEEVGKDIAESISSAFNSFRGAHWR